MKEKLVSLTISSGLIIAAGYKLVSYADTSLYGTVTTERLNVRSGPSTSYHVLGILTKGSTVQIVDKTGDWIKINYKNSYAYVSGRYVSESNGKATSQGTISGCSYLNVRSGPGTEYSCKGSVAAGEKVQIISSELGWYKIAYKGGYGYISGKYVVTNSVDINNNSNGSNSGSDSGGNIIQINKTGTVTASILNVRKSSSTSSAILGTLARNSIVQIVGQTENWYKIIYKNDYAFVAKDYVSLGGTQDGSNQTITNLNDFLFIGDSFTSRLKYTIQAKTTNAYVNAKGGVFPSYWLDNFSQMPDDSKVKGIVLLIGINGISRESNLTDTKKLIDLLVQKYPGKNIYVQRVFPVGKGYAGYSDMTVANYNKNRIDTFNAKIKAYCSTKPSRVKFIDATSGFVDSNGFLINCEDDGLHILESYNNKFYNNIQSAVINAK